jgi:L-asparaginase
VLQGRYATSMNLRQIGVISGTDLTTEAAVTKLMLLLGEYDVDTTKTMINKSIAGEMSF